MQSTLNINPCEEINCEKTVEKNSQKLEDIFDKNKENQSVVVRITDFCNNTCEHCCYSCSPNGKNFMSLETMVELSEVFRDTDKVCYWFNVMGGRTHASPDL